MRSKLLLLGGIVLAGALALLGGSQTWITFLLDGSHSVETITGHGSNPALSPIAIALIAAALALTIAGPVFRRVLGLLVVLLGGGVIALASGVLVAPLAVASGRITELTGLIGAADANEVLWVQISGWIWVTVIAGIAAVLLGVGVTLFSGGWATAGKKYESAGAAGSAGTTAIASDRISEWDALSQGEDPSEYFR